VPDPAPDRAARARELRSQGLVLREIAEQLGVSSRTVVRWLNPEQAERDRQRSRQAKHTRRRPCERCTAPLAYDRAGGLCALCLHGDAHQRVERVAALYQDGHEPREIARNVGLSQGYVSNLLVDLAREKRIQPRWTLRDRRTARERERQMLILISQKRPRREIARQVGLTYGSLSTVLARMRDREPARPAA